MLAIRFLFYFIYAIVASVGCKYLYNVLHTLQRAQLALGTRRGFTVHYICFGINVDFFPRFRNLYVKFAPYH